MKWKKELLFVYARLFVFLQYYENETFLYRSNRPVIINKYIKLHISMSSLTHALFTDM
jgi:hypothetical protein